MLNIGQIIFPLRKGQDASSKLMESLEIFAHEEGKLFSRYASFENNLMRAFENEYANISVSSAQIVDFMAFLIKSLRNMTNTQLHILPTDMEVMDVLSEYLNFISQGAMHDQLQHVHDALNFHKKTFDITGPYSYEAAAKLLSSSNISLDSATQLMKSLYFAHDYLNIKAVLRIRKYIFTFARSNDYIPLPNMVKMPGTNWLALLFSDISLFRECLIFYEFLVSKSEPKMLLFLLAKEEELDWLNVNLLCILGYFRCFIAILIAVIQSDKTNFFDGKNIVPYLLNVYRQFGYCMLTSFYENLTIMETLMLPSLLLLEDICPHIASTYNRKKLEKIHSLVSAISRDSALEDFTPIVKKIGNLALKKWQNGSELSHIQMLNTFKKSEKYASYFSKRGFETKLRKYLIEICKANTIKRIAGIDIPARQKRRAV